MGMVGVLVVLSILFFIDIGLVWLGLTRLGVP